MIQLIYGIVPVGFGSRLLPRYKSLMFSTLKLAPGLTSPGLLLLLELFPEDADIATKTH